MIVVLGVAKCPFRGVPVTQYVAPLYMSGSKNSGTTKSSILIGFSIIIHFGRTPIFGNTHIRTTVLGKVFHDPT